MRTPGSGRSFGARLPLVVSRSVECRQVVKWAGARCVDGASGPLMQTHHAGCGRWEALRIGRTSKQVKVYTRGCYTKISKFLQHSHRRSLQVPQFRACDRADDPQPLTLSAHHRRPSDVHHGDPAERAALGTVGRLSVSARERSVQRRSVLA